MWVLARRALAAPGSVAACSVAAGSVASDAVTPGSVVSNGVGWDAVTAGGRSGRAGAVLDTMRGPASQAGGGVPITPAVGDDGAPL